MPSRKSITRAQRGFRVKYPSRKVGQMIECESILEADFVRILEFSPGVSFFESQPEEITYWDGERMRVYFPDFAARLRNETCIHFEVKPSSELAKPLVAKKYRLIAAHYRQFRIENFRIVTELEIRRDPLYANVRRLSYSRPRGNVETPTCASLKKTLGASQVSMAHAESALGSERVWQLLAAGHLACDLAQLVTPETNLIVVPPKGGSNAAMFV